MTEMDWEKLSGRSMRLNWILLCVDEVYSSLKHESKVDLRSIGGGEFETDKASFDWKKINHEWMANHMQNDVHVVGEDNGLLSAVNREIGKITGGLE